MRRGNSLIFLIAVLIVWVLVEQLFPQYWLPFYLVFSLLISFMMTILSIPPMLRKSAMRSPMFHRQVIMHFLFYMILGVIMYVIL